MPENEMVTAALFYAEECGLRVIPVPPREKGPRLKNWPDRATTDPEEIKEMWHTQPDSKQIAADFFYGGDIKKVEELIEFIEHEELYDLDDLKGRKRTLPRKLLF